MSAAPGRAPGRSQAGPNPPGGSHAVLRGRGVDIWPGWNQLPREARDTLFQLIVLGWTVAPHFLHLAPWCIAMTVVVMLWRAVLAVRNRVLPGRWPLIAVLALACGMTLFSERTLVGKQAGVTMLVVLVGLKMLEMRGRRDALVVFFLGFFLVLTHCLYSQSIWIALSMAVSTWGLLTAQVLASMPVGLPSLKRASAIALRAAGLGVPLMLVLFLLFPRFGPLWGLPQDAMGRTGLSSTLRLGGLADVANDDSIAFRIRFEGRSASADQLYFRGPVLSGFDGIEWRAAPTLNPAATQQRLLPRGLGSALRYEMLLEPIRLPLLPLLEATPDLPGAAPDLPGWGLTLGHEAIDEFWLDRKVGFCEHFAASFTFLMRAMGVPTRIVTGYQGAEDADADGWRVVRQSHAHAWAEYWVAGSGWVRADPTAAVAPDRIDRSRPLAPEPGLMASALRTWNPALFADLRRAFELLDNRWNQWVMSYSRSRQFDLLEALGLQSPDVLDLAKVLIGVLSAAALAGAAWAWADRRRQDPWQRLHKHLCAGLVALGVPALPHHDPRRLAALLRHRFDEAAATPLASLLDALDRSRYGPANQRLPGVNWRAAFDRELSKLQRALPG
ncbi:MAG: DUF3488 domain-containing transglutaminase family protein [Burkholderiales bacterium]|nr:DUF3488 domain-containing transglutaminase family protein [Burkholderiales bacterium]